MVFTDDLHYGPDAIHMAGGSPPSPRPLLG